MPLNRTVKFVLACLALLLLTLLISGYQAAERGDELRLWFLDVGQGDAILIDTPEHQQILIDGGPNASVVQEIARALPVTDKELDLVISTHNDADHLSGLNDVLRHYRVNKIWLTGAVHTTKTYQTFQQLIQERAIPTEKITAGATIKFGQLEGIAIHPFERYDGVTPEAQNITGIVTYWQYGAQTFLLTADVEAAQEQAMLARGVVRPARILKVGHHGSRTSSTDAFLRQVSPAVAVIQVGKNNRYGHPVAEILERLATLNATVLRTDQDGTIRFDLWPDRYSYRTGL